MKKRIPLIVLSNDQKKNKRKVLSLVTGDGDFRAEIRTYCTVDSREEAKGGIMLSADELEVFLNALKANEKEIRTLIDAIKKHAG